MVILVLMFCFVFLIFFNVFRSTSVCDSLYELLSKSNHFTTFQTDSSDWELLRICMWVVCPSWVLKTALTLIWKCVRLVYMGTKVATELNGCPKKILNSESKKSLFQAKVSFHKISKYISAVLLLVLLILCMPLYLHKEFCAKQFILLQQHPIRDGLCAHIHISTLLYFTTCQ